VVWWSHEYQWFEPPGQPGLFTWNTRVRAVDLPAGGGRSEKQTLSPAEL
jgi:hypothetical protein